jgi:hypothetical protein
MRGGFLHNEVLVKRLRQMAQECGAAVHLEAPVRIDGVVNYIDLAIEKGGQVTVCEPEQSWRRVDNDVRKAVAFGAQRLLIVTPDSHTAQACRRQLRRHTLSGAKLQVIACPLGAALEILRQALDNTPNAPAAPLPPGQGKES